MIYINNRFYIAPVDFAREGEKGSLLVIWIAVEISFGCEVKSHYAHVILCRRGILRKHLILHALTGTCSSAKKEGQVIFHTYVCSTHN